MKLKDVPKCALIGTRFTRFDGTWEIQSISYLTTEDKVYEKMILHCNKGNILYKEVSNEKVIFEEEPKKMNEDKNASNLYADKIQVEIKMTKKNKPAYFDGVKVGDKVWSIEYGWGVIHKVLNSNRVEYVRVDFPNNQTYNEYYLNGKRNSLATTMQTLFWDEVKFEAPKKPEKWVTKKGEVSTLCEAVEMWRVMGGEKKRKVTKVTETYYTWEELES